MTNRPLAAVVVLCLLFAPVISLAMDLHALSHDAQEAAQAHHPQSNHDHADDHDGDDSPSPLHDVLHGVHVCGHGLGIPPSLTLPALTSAPVSPILQSDTGQANAPTNPLFRPPRQN